MVSSCCRVRCYREHTARLHNIQTGSHLPQGPVGAPLPRGCLSVCKRCQLQKGETPLLPFVYISILWLVWIDEHRAPFGAARISSAGGDYCFCVHFVLCCLTWRWRTPVLPTPVCIISFQWAHLCIQSEISSFPHCGMCRGTVSLNRVLFLKKAHQWHAHACIICQSGTSSLDIICGHDEVRVQQS